MNVFLRDLSDDEKSVDHVLIGHRNGNVTIEEARSIAANYPPEEWPEEWRVYERKSYPRFGSGITLPDVSTGITHSRASVRSFQEHCLGIEELSAVLASQRILKDSTSGSTSRHCPSAGRLYPIELYVLPVNSDLEGMVHYYDAEEHALVPTLELPSEFKSAPHSFLATTECQSTAAIIVLTGVLYRSMRKYQSRGYRFILLEAGAMAQALDDSTRSAGLASCWLGGFDDDRLADLIGVKPALELEVPLLVMAIGRPV